MKESNLRDKFTAAVKSENGDVTNHEDRFNFGVPDSSYGLNGVNGWVEIKYVKAFPKRETTPINAGIRKEQVIWMEKRHPSGGHCFVLIGVSNRIFLFNGDLIRVLYNKLTKNDYHRLALIVWTGQIDPLQLSSLLSG